MAATRPGAPDTSVPDSDDQIILSAGGEEADRPGATDRELFLPSGRIDPEALAQARQASLEDPADQLTRVTFILRRDLRKRLDKYLTDRIGFMSRNQLQKLIDKGGVWVNDRACKASTVLRLGDTVEVLIPPPPSTEIQPEDIPLEVMYEDEHLIVINKTPDIIVHPARSHNCGTMINALAWHFQSQVGRASRPPLTPAPTPQAPSLSNIGKEFARPGVVHRLDRATSGVIIFAKQDEAHWKLGHQFEHRRVDKRYLAIVHGRIEPDIDIIDLPIGPHPSREKGYREKYVVRHDEQGKSAVTIYRVREQYNAHHPDPSQRFTLVELELKTGRTHQIRVHLSYNNWPIVGDDMYGGKPVLRDDGSPIIARQALHATILGLTHPITGDKLEFTAPLRGDMAELIRHLRATTEVRRPDPPIPGATINLERAIGEESPERKLG
jgi:23S rRNA pseudouridine1911/1915/1917 synthase